MRWGWIVAGSSLLLFSIGVGKWGHEYKAVPYNEVTAQTAILTVAYEQPNAVAGKMGSAILALGAIACFKAGTGKDRQGNRILPNPIAPTPVPHPVATPQVVSRSPFPSPAASKSTSVQYDSEELVVPALPQQVAQPQPEKRQVSIFDRVLTHRKKHLLIPCETGSGKTTFELGLIDFCREHWGDKAEFYHSTAKPQSTLGLEDVQAADCRPHSFLVSRENPESIVWLRDRLAWLNRRLTQRGETRQQAERDGRKFTPPPIRIIIDEWQKTMLVAETYDRKNGTDIENEIIDLIVDFAVSGREDDIALWIFGQDHQVQNLHKRLNKGIQKQFGLIVLGIQGNLGSISDALYGRSPLLNRKETKDEVWKQVQVLASANPKRGVCYSNLYSHEVLEVPYLPDIKRKRIWGKESNVVQFPDNKPQELELEDVWA